MVGSGGEGGRVSAYSFILGMGGLRHGVLSVACSRLIPYRQRMSRFSLGQNSYFAEDFENMQNEIFINTSFVTS